MLRQLRTAVIGFAALTILTGLVYPLAVTGVAQLAFHAKARGSLVNDDGGVVVGSSLIGQQFAAAKYFHPRPSPAGDGLRRDGERVRQPRPDESRACPGRRPRRSERIAARTASTPPPSYRSMPSPPRHQASTRTSRSECPPAGAARRARSWTAARRVLALVDRYTEGRSLGFLGEAAASTSCCSTWLSTARALVSNVALDGPEVVWRMRRGYERRRGDRGGGLEPAAPRGSLRVYLGAAPGVGKTFAMLNEGRRRPDAGQGRRRRLRRAARAGAHRRADRRSRGRAAPRDQLPRHDLRGDGRRRRPGPAPRARPRRRTGPHQRARLASTRSAGRTSRSCSPPASRHHAPSTSSTSSRSTTSSSASPA